MSCTELIYFNDKGECIKEESVKNAWLGAFQIWKRLFEKYYPNGNWNEEMYTNYCKNVWNLTDNFNLTGKKSPTSIGGTMNCLIN